MDISTVFTVVMVLLGFKSIIIGSEFSFGKYLKYKSKYSDWYFNRETFEEYLNNTSKE